MVPDWLRRRLYAALDFALDNAVMTKELSCRYASNTGLTRLEKYDAVIITIPVTGDVDDESVYQEMEKVCPAKVK